MNPVDKKASKEAWKNRRPNMGVFSLTCLPTGDVFLGVSADTDRAMNGQEARLTLGSHRNKRLQKLWDAHGADAFAYQVVEPLEYDDPSENHSEDLKALLALVLERMPEAGTL